MARKLGAQPEAIVNGKFGKFEGRNVEAINKNFEILFRRLGGVSNAGVAHTILSAIHSDVTVDTPVTGDLLYYTGSTWARLALGAAGRVLTVSGGVPTWALLVDANIDPAAAIAWSKVSKSGSSLADLDTRSASDLSSGTLPDARFPATLPAISGASLTNLDASDLASGTVPDARLSSNVALEDVANTFTEKQTISRSKPILVLNDTGEAADARKIRFSLDGGIMSLESADDAETVFGEIWTTNRNTGLVTLSTLSIGGGKITFPASQSASADANTLDDYEEGSWTPVIGGTGGQSGQAYSGQTGRYVKIGSMVAVFYEVVLSTKGTITGNVQVSGLPFTAEATASRPTYPTQWSNLATNWVFICGLVLESTTTILVRGAAAAAASADTSLVTADINDNTFFRGAAVYKAAS